MNVLNKILEFNDIDKDNIKIQLMKQSPFAFFRGTSHLFFEQLSNYTNAKLFKQKEFFCWVQGDAHIGNLGFSNKKCSLNNEVRFDINDFDESYIGNPFLDIIRFGVSIGFFFDDISSKKNTLKEDENLEFLDMKIIDYFAKKYFKYVTKKEIIEYEFKKSKFMTFHKKKALKKANPNHEKSRIRKFTINDGSKIKFDLNNPKITHISQSKKTKLLNELSKIYDNKIIDICKRKTAGVGSSHLDRYYMLLEEKEGVIMLEIKEQLYPSYIEFIDTKEHLESKPSKLHIKAKKTMIENYDLQLRSFSFLGKDYIIKSVFNAKHSIDAEDFFKFNDLNSFEENLKEYIDFCAIALSNAHKRSALDKKEFIKKMKEIKKEHFFEVESLIFKSFSINMLLYSHFIRDLK